MHSGRSSYARWSWIIALILALVILWMLLTGRGPNNACCTPTNLTASSDMMPSTIDAFSFTATADSFTSNGDTRNISWVTNVDVLKTILSGDIKAEGNSKTVTLTGSADADNTKQKKGLDAQMFFGSDVTVDNQITVGNISGSNGAEFEAAGDSTPLPSPIAKLYFNFGMVSLPVDSQTTLQPIVGWLNAYPDSKAIISGFHDPTGGKAINEAIAKDRAQSAYDALITLGVDATKIEMRKPISTEGDGALAEARRVEVTVE